jgi:hypothetical protein
MPRITLAFRTAALLLVLVLLPWSTTAEKLRTASKPIR